ncbi:MAG: hypothetical protein EBR33_06870 [Synechococcaceae bacterium WB4_1_0192]|nr:hypothetical protein [Synechococcaceae bacterium WB4_1_0192]
MAVLQDGTAGSILARIFNTSKGLASMLVAEDGTTIPKTNGEARGASDGFLAIGGVNDDSYRPARTDRLGNLVPGTVNLLLHEPFEGATSSSPNRVTLATTTFTQAQTAAGGLNLNNGNSAASAAAALLTTNRQFAKLQRAPLQCKIRARANHVANAVMEFGFGNPANQTSAPTIGAFWQITTGGVVQPVLTFNGVDVTGAAVTMPSGWQSNYHTWDVILDDDEVFFTVQDTSTGQLIAERRIQLAVTQVRLWNASRLPAFARLHNVTAPASAPTLILSSLDVVMLDMAQNKTWAQIAALSGFGGEVNPTTFAQTANYANSAAAANATLSNTAAGYTTLGGQFQFAAVAGAETDFALFGFTVPAPYSFVCAGIEIDTFNSGAAVATTAHVLQWFASPDQTAISLATATNRRLTLGVQSFAVGAAIGALAAPIIRDLSDAPLVTNPGRIMVVGLKIPVGTATASQIIRGTVAIRGYFE